MTTDQPGTDVETVGSGHQMGPIAADKRIVSVDVLRGIAILIILTGNIYFYSHPLFVTFPQYLEWTGVDPSTRTLDLVVYRVLDLLLHLTMASLYACLFGFGVAILMDRAETHRKPFAGVYLRRLLAMLAIGVCHVAFVWPGDILITYAVAGLVLLGFRRRSPRTVVVWAVVFLLIWALAFTAPIALANLASTSARGASTQPTTTPTSSPSSATTAAPTSAAATTRPTLKTAFKEFALRSIDVYKHGTYGAVTAHRLRDYGVWLLTSAYHQYPLMIGMMLLGLYAGRRGLLADVPGHLGTIRRIALWGFIVGAASSLTAAVVEATVPAGEPSPLWAAYAAGRAVGAPALTVFYASAVVLLLQREVWQRWLGLFASVGRMSLSNYLFQSLVGTLIFYGYGLGFYGRIGPALGVLLAVGFFFAVQLPLSAYWMRSFRLGPIEWLWRTLTYGSLPGLRQPRERH